MRNKDVKKRTLFERILSDENIFEAIYSMESYILEKNLLSEEDLKLYVQLQDKYDKELILDTIKRCKTLLIKVLDEKSKVYFEIQVFFKAKKWNEDDKRVECRPLHTASLITQICIVCLLNAIMFKQTNDGRKQLSDLAQLIPENFYGNIPSLEPEKIFYDWREKYKQYTENVLHTYDEAVHNHSYKYEVALDLVKFFPSVDPKVLYAFCIEHLKYVYLDEVNQLKIILQKLLEFKIANLHSKQVSDMYYGEHWIGSRSYSRGIPQGLPQSYFFGNVCMMIIHKQFEKMFPGKAFFYVDDSVIFTNSENASENNFYQSIETLNKNINAEMKKYYSGDVRKYNIEVHKDNKSTSSEIQNSQNLTKAFLSLVAKEASGIGYDIKSTINTLEDIALGKKIEQLDKAVDKELKNLTEYENGLQDQNQLGKSFVILYKKSLNRYKKFFKYRKHLLSYRNDKECAALEREFEKMYFQLNISDSKRKQIMEYMDADNFLAEAQLIYKSKVTEDERKKFTDCICRFEKKLLDDIDDCNLYFSRNFKYVKVHVTPYDSLNKVVKERIPDFSNGNIESSIDFIKKNILCVQSVIEYGDSYDKNIWKNSNEYRRKILNACISRAFNIYVSDDLRIYRMDRRNVSYYELCLFAFLRNRNAQMKELQLPNDSLKDEKIGYDIYEVLDLFVKYVKNSKYIENLIMIHKYISSIWKNGSRFLYFYTLHNQEHSIELIKRVVSLCKVIDYFTIKNEDYYILFLCCYLHDVSMAIQPKLDSFTSDNQETDILSAQFYMELQYHLKNLKYDKNELKGLMRWAFEKVNIYFESIARDRHAYDSAAFIKNSNDLSLLSPTVRKEVAAISEAHAYGFKDVYDLKSMARSECISEKYLMILLRIADIVDGAKDRVSLNILRRNISNMPEESKFHWVTHAITDVVEITSEYEFVETSKKDDKTKFYSVLNQRYLKENIIVTIKVNEYNLTKVQCNNCRNVSAVLNKKTSEIVMDLGTDMHCDSEKCTFLCKWLMTKNNYLLEELNALQLYFQRNQSNLFDTKVKLKLDFSNAKTVDPTYYTIVDRKIN